MKGGSTLGVMAHVTLAHYHQTRKPPMPRRRLPQNEYLPRGLYPQHEATLSQQWSEKMTEPTQRCEQWRVITLRPFNSVYLRDDNFARELSVYGSFESLAEKTAYAEEIARRLNANTERAPVGE